LDEHLKRGASSVLKQQRKIFMVGDSRTRALVEAIDDAIELAEDLGLTFVAGILMMARLETVQTEHQAVMGRESRQLS
jgi:hypothetical protein